MTLGGLLLLVAAFATAMASYRVKHQLAEVQASLQSLRHLARVLRVDDLASIAVITRMATRPDELIFDLHIPEAADGGSHQLALVLDGISQQGDERPAAQYTHSIAPGRHTVEVVHERPPSDDPAATHRIVIVLDDATAIETTRPQSWIETLNWSASGGFTETTSFPADKPAELYRRRYSWKTDNGSTTPPADRPANGMLLWIEPSQ